MGFYGNISGSNKSAFTFDKVYPNRNAMDNSTSIDGVFLGRYVLVEYDDTPINIYIYNGRYYLDLSHKTEVTLKKGCIYKNVTPNTTNTGKYFEVDNYDAINYKNENDEDLIPYVYNYKIDVNNYGRGYDGTVWRKIFDTSLNANGQPKNVYRYVMLAELNAAIPTWHMIVQPPTAAIANPTLDTIDSTNLNYYLQMKASYLERFDTTNDATNSVLLNQAVPTYSYTNGVETVTMSTSNVKADINLNQAGFSPTTRASSSVTNAIGHTLTSSGRCYNNGPAGTPYTAADTKLWYIHLPAIGNAVCDMYDKIYGFSGTTRTTANYIKTSLTDNKIYGYDTLVGALNETRDILGYNVKFVTSAPTASTANNVNLQMVGSNSNISNIYYYADQPIYEQSNTGEFYKDTSVAGSTVYRLATADTSIIPQSERYTVSKHTYIPIRLAAPQNGLYGTLVYLHRVLGTGVTNARDPNTVAGMIGRMEDLISNISTSLASSRLLATNNKGRIDTTATVFPITGSSATTSQVLGANGSWVSRFASMSVTNNTSGNTTAATITPADGTVTSATSATTTINNQINLISKNTWLELTSNNTNKSITIAHKLSGIITAASTSTTSFIPSANDSWKSNTAATNKITFPYYTIDAAGHITASATTSFYLPHNFQKMTVGDSSTSTSSITAASGTIEPDLWNDILTFAPGNKWLVFAADTDNDKITIAHATSALSAGTIAPSAGTGWNLTNHSDNSLVIPSITTDAAGHVIGTGASTYYMPHGLKTINIATQSTVATNSTANTTSIIAASAAEAFTLATANKWLTISGNNSTKTLTFGHIISGITAGTYGDTGANNSDTVASTVHNASGKFNIPYFAVDEAGHINFISTETITLNNNFEKVVINANTTNTVLGLTALTSASTLTPTWHRDALQFAATNDWIKLGVIDTTTDLKTIQIAHKVVTPTTTTTSISLDDTQTFDIQTITWDAAGHIDSSTITTHTLPDRFKYITIGSSSISANIYSDTLGISGDSWINITGDGTAKTISVAHTTLHSKSISATQSAATAAFGTAIAIPSLAIDKAGHVTSLDTINITLPQPATALLTGYDITSSTGSIAASDTINQAFAKLENQISTLSNTSSEAYLTKTDAARTYLTITAATGTYLTIENANINYLNKDDIESTYLKSATAQTVYLTQDDASSTYQTKPTTGTFALESFVTSKIEELFTNYNFTLKMPEFVDTRSTIVNNKDMIQCMIASTDLEGTYTLQLFKKNVNTNNDWTLNINSTANSFDGFGDWYGFEIEAGDSTIDTEYKFTLTRTYENTTTFIDSDILYVDYDT